MGTTSGCRVVSIVIAKFARAWLEEVFLPSAPSLRTHFQFKLCDLNSLFSYFLGLISHVILNMVMIMLTSAFHQVADLAKSIFSLAELGHFRRTTRSISDR
ncbi:hypothetical protein ABLF39_001353 [Aeromonas hydrophila]